MARTKFYCGPKTSITRAELQACEDSGEYVIDEKYDGCWTLIRVVNGEIEYMESRVGKEFAHAQTDGLYGLNLWNADMYPHRSVLIGEVEPDIVDGSKSGTRRLKLFDIIVEGEDDLRDLTLEVRRIRLEALYAQMVDHRCGKNIRLVQLAEQHSTGFLKFFDEVLARDGEGLVVKKRLSLYQPKNGDGKIKEWMKCKPNRLVDYVCTGHGLAKKDTPNLELSLWKGDELKKVLTTGVPKELWDLPIESFVGQVLEVKGMEIFASGALRHAHIQRVRTDKPPEDCTHEAAMNAQKIA